MIQKSIAYHDFIIFNVLIQYSIVLISFSNFKQSIYFLAQNDTTKHGWTPITTATSVLGVQFDSGVAIAADTLTSYGSMACFENNPRILKVK